MAKKKAKKTTRKKPLPKQIRITCKGAAMVLLCSLQHFQSNLKTLSEKEYAKLRKAIETSGFSFPLFVWRDKRGCHKVIDGHQRLFTIQQMMKEGYTLAGGKLPVAWIEANSEKEAKKKVLLAASQYGRYTEESVYEFIGEGGLDFSELKLEMDLPQIHMGKLEVGWFKDEAPEIETADIRHCSWEELKPTREERAKLKGKRFLVEFSGGKDSTSAVLWAKKFYPESKITLCYVDMGADYVGFHQHLDSVANCLECELEVLRSELNIIDVFLKKREWPHHTHPYCHNYLHGPMDVRWLREAPKDIIILRGGRYLEKAARAKKQADRFLTLKRMPEYLFFQPLYFTNKNLAEQMLREAGLSIWCGYERGLGRTACRICPGQTPATYAAIRRNYPDVWKELLWLEKKLGVGYWSSWEGAPKCFETLADKGENGCSS